MLYPIKPIKNYSLEHLYNRIFHEYFDFLMDVFNNQIDLSFNKITIVTKNCITEFKQLPSYSWWPKNAKLKIDLEENCAGILSIYMNDTIEKKQVDNSFETIYTKYINQTDDIYRIDETSFIVLSNNIDIVSNILNEISEIFNYNYISNKHIFTLK